MAVSIVANKQNMIRPRVVLKAKGMRERRRLEKKKNTKGEVRNGTKIRQKREREKI